MHKEPSPYEIIPITEAHIEGFNKAVDSVAREHLYLAFLYGPPLEQSQAFVLENLRDGNPQVVAMHHGEVIGWCDIASLHRHVFEHSGVLGMGIIAPYRGKGIGKRLMYSALEMAKTKGLTRIELTARENNHRAIALYKQFGFVAEGLKRNATRINGVYENDVIMGLLLESSDKKAMAVSI